MNLNFVARILQRAYFIVHLEDLESHSGVPNPETPRWNFERPYLTGRHIFLVPHSTGSHIFRMVKYTVVGYYTYLCEVFGALHACYTL